MASYQCGLCSYLYDEDLEGRPWSELPGDWVCPICGSGKAEFSCPSPPVAQVSPAPAVLNRSFECELCSHVYDEAREGVAWEELGDEWSCPLCGSSREDFRQLDPVATKRPTPHVSQTSGPVGEDYLGEWRRSGDDAEGHMADIHRMARSAKVIIEPMRTRAPVVSWDEILVKGAQLARLPLNKTQPVHTRTVIGPRAQQPLVLETPVYISHMSFGALSREAKTALARGSARAGTATCSGEGGILPEELASAHRYIFEYVPNKYSVTDEYLARVDAVEIKIGQSAKPGMGGHLPGGKVTREIAEIRGFREGVDIISPAHFPDIRSAEDLRRTVDWLREKTSGKPVGLKLAAGSIEDDLAVALSAGVDFVTLDGRAGGTGAAPKLVKATASVPTIFALVRARRFLDEQKAEGVSLIITGGLRVSSDFAKALALGADAVAIATAGMIACGCQQYRICDTGRCPVGIATQDPALRARLDVERSAEMVANFLKVSTQELSEFARMTGNHDVHDLSVRDLCTTNSEISGHTPIEHV